VFITCHNTIIQETRMLCALTMRFSIFVYTRVNTKYQNTKLHESIQGRAIAQAVSRRLPTTAVRARSQVMSCGNCGGQSGSVAGFLRVHRPPLLIIVAPTAPH
jgi:hypothetical protein